MNRRLPTWREDDRLRDECGIVAVSGAGRASQLAFLGLYALQHRGQESCGVVSIDESGDAHTHKAMGLVADAFDDATLARLAGSTALGHTRYSTAGASRLRNAQPVVVNYRHGTMTLAHNGTLTNAGALRDRLTDEGAIFQTDSDSEAVIHLIARSRRGSPDQQVDDALSQLVGAFSIVMSIGNTVYAVRDARGFRPLVLGRLDDAAVVASETCALDIMGADYVRDVQPGEVLKICDGIVTNLRPLEPRSHSPCLFELVYFARPDSRMGGCSVDAARR
ncbi:MAG: amidophosphoribosyltransferase, partial [Gemmatimonadota bacterium]